MKKAFSLLELSIIILVISVALAAYFATNGIVDKSRIASANSLTRNSSVDKIENLYLWLETTLPESLIASQAQEEIDINEDTFYDGISTWYDLQTQTDKHDATQNSTGSQPHYYRNCINKLPCIRFTRDSEYVGDYMSVDLSGMANNDYTIFVVEQRRSGGSNIILGDSSSPTNPNYSVEIGYNASGYGYYAQTSSSNYYSFGVSSPSFSSSYDSPTPRLHSFISPIFKTSNPAGVYHYLNGRSSASTFTETGTPVFSAIQMYSAGSIGYGKSSSGSNNYYDGDIGEIIIYTRALETYEREAIEAYLLKKWKIQSL